MEHQISQTERHMISQIVNITHKCGHIVRKRLVGYDAMPGTKENQIKKKIQYYQSTNCPACYNYFD